MEWFESLEHMGERIEILFKEIFVVRRPLFRTEKSFSPSVDIYETDKELVVVADMAGIKKKEIKIQIEERKLKIYGIRREDLSYKKLRLYQMEINFGRFERVVDIPIAVKKNGISAKYDDGILYIIFPKIIEEEIIEQVEIIEES